MEHIYRRRGDDFSVEYAEEEVGKRGAKRL